MKTATLLMLLSIFSCKAPKTSTENTDQTSTDSSALAAAYTGTNPFGILVNIADGIPPGLDKKLSVAKDLGVPYIRSTMALTGGTINYNEYRAFESNGFKVILNINYARQLMDGKTQIRSAPTNIPEYKLLLTNAVADIKPELVAIENEENNLFYYNVNPQAYLKELGAAIEVLHAKGIKVTNGGIVSRTILLLVYEDYLTRGLKKEAADYASRAMIQDLTNDFPGLQKHKIIQKQMSMIKQLLEGYRKLPLDYVNFHWYEPVSGRGASQAQENIKTIDTRLSRRRGGSRHRLT